MDGPSHSKAIGRSSTNHIHPHQPRLPPPLPYQRTTKRENATPTATAKVKTSECECICGCGNSKSGRGTKLECPDYGGVLISEGVVLCTDFNGVELGPEDVSLLERCPLLGTSQTKF